MMRFRKTTARLSSSAARRQGDMTRLAVTVLGPEAAILFMNADNAALGGRPIDLAVASDEGRVQVERALARAGK